MAQTEKLGLYLIDESTPLNASNLNTNFETVSRTLGGTALSTIQQGALVDNDLLNTNF
jgi:hypothetical protein